MKKLFLYVILSLMWCNISFAGQKDSVNYYTKQNYKIIKHISVDDGRYQVITLKKGGHVIICSVKFNTKYMIHEGTICFEP